MTANRAEWSDQRGYIYTEVGPSDAVILCPYKDSLGVGRDGRLVSGADLSVRLPRGPSLNSGGGGGVKLSRFGSRKLYGGGPW